MRVPYAFFAILFMTGLYVGQKLTVGPTFPQTSPVLPNLDRLVVDKEPLQMIAAEDVAEVNIEPAVASIVDEPEVVEETAPAKVYAQTPKGEWILTLKDGQSLNGLLQNINLNKSVIYRALKALTPVYDPRKFRPGQEFFVKTKVSDKGVQLLSIRFSLDLTSDVEVLPVKNNFHASIKKLPLKHKMRLISGEVGKSLISSLKAQGLEGRHLNNLIVALRQQIDLNRDVTASDTFEVAFDELYKDDDRKVGIDMPMYALLTHKKGALKMYSFTSANGSQSYYMDNARPMYKSFLMRPIRGARMSSPYGWRTHPKLKCRRLHKGMDYAAPKNTPVTASADGVVVSAGYNKGYGRYVRIRHNSQYETAYAHLNRIYVQKGDRVRQGTKIGGVGCTGLATGNHLHYEVLERGRQVNPMSVKSFGTGMLEGKDLKRFKSHMRGLDLKFAALRTSKKQG